MEKFAHTPKPPYYAAIFTSQRTDGDHGYGNAMNVQRTVRAYGRAGAAAVLIEDKITPRALTQALKDPDPAVAKRVFEAMMTMRKIDIAAIEAARRG